MDLDRSEWPREIGVGMSVAALGVPGGLALAQLSGLPPQAGLYACIVPTLVYALVGHSSRFLIVGPDTPTCMLIAVSLTGLGAVTPAARAEMVAPLSMLVGILCLAAWATRLGVISSLISKAVLVGYLAGVAISLFISQLSPLTGLELKASGLIAPIVEIVRRHAEIHWPTVTMATALFLVLRLCKAYLPRVPGTLVVIILGIAASTLLDFGALGISTIGAVPSGLPTPHLPSLAWDPMLLLESAVGITIVSCSSGLITARAFGQQVGIRSRPNRELAGFGLANIAASLFQGFAVTASDSRTATAIGSGGRSALVGISAAVTVAFVALYLTSLVSLLPHAALAAILASAAVDLFDHEAFLRLARIGKQEVVLALIATVGVVTIGVLEGVIIAVGATMVNLIVLAARPATACLAGFPRPATSSRGGGIPAPSRPIGSSSICSKPHCSSSMRTSSAIACAWR
jgi:MFS superfamily sulfate permease-like transporter